MRRVVQTYGSALLALAAGLAFLPARAAGQGLPFPLAINTPDVITDEFGEVLQGNANLPPDQCDLVQVLWASNQVIYPPNPDGTPDPRNPPVRNGAFHIGCLIAHDRLRPGQFGLSIVSNRPPPNSYLFVRVFNAPTLEEASFYANSQVLRAPASLGSFSVLAARFGATTNAIDPADDDADGLNNSWEKSLGSDRGNPDTDGDGMPDGQEFRAGTDLLDPMSLLVHTEVRGEGPETIEYDEHGEPYLLTRYEDVVVSWQSVPGKRYQLQYTTNALSADPLYVDLYEPVTATEAETTLVVTNGLADGMRSYRVRLVEQ